MKALIGHTFKGNARELENVAKRFCLIFRSTKKKGALDKIIEACLGKKISTVPSGESQDLLKIAAQCSEKQLIENLLKTSRFKADVAKKLGVAHSTLWRKMKKYGIHI